MKLVSILIFYFFWVFGLNAQENLEEEPSPSFSLDQEIHWQGIQLKVPQKIKEYATKVKQTKDFLSITGIRWRLFVRYHNEDINKEGIEKLREYQKTEIQIGGQQATLIRYEQPESSIGIRYQPHGYICYAKFPHQQHQKKPLIVYFFTEDKPLSSLVDQIFLTLKFTHNDQENFSEIVSGTINRQSFPFECLKIDYDKGILQCKVRYPGNSKETFVLEMARADRNRPERQMSARLVRLHQSPQEMMVTRVIRFDFSKRFSKFTKPFTLSVGTSEKNSRQVTIRP